VCVSLYVHTCVHVCAFVHLCSQVCACKPMQTYGYPKAHVRECMHVCDSVCRSLCMHAHVCASLVCTYATVCACGGTCVPCGFARVYVSM
jgi:hypothetical protein